MSLEVVSHDGADVRSVLQLAKKARQLQQLRVCVVVEPALDRDAVVHLSKQNLYRYQQRFRPRQTDRYLVAVSVRAVVHQHSRAEVSAQDREIL